MRKYCSCLLVALGLFYSPHAAIVLSADTEMPLHANRDAYLPCAAFAKDNYLVVWQSGRIGPGSIRKNVNYIGDIVGACVSKTGTVLSTEPFVICGATDLQERPRAAAVKDTVLVVWQDLRNNRDWDIFAARVLADGTVLDPNGFRVSGGAHNQAKPNVAWDGKHFIVVWQDFRNNKKYMTYAARITSGGQRLDTAGILLSSGNPNGNNIDPTLASAGNERSFIFWACAGGPMATGLFLTQGVPGTAFFKLVQSDYTSRINPGFGGNTPTFAAAGPGVFLLAWRNEHPVGRGNGENGGDAMVFDSLGNITKSLSLNGSSQRILNADLAWDGTAFVAAWTEMRDKSSQTRVDYPSGDASERVLVSRLTVAGVIADSTKEVAGTFAAPAMNAAVATDGAGTTLIAYEKQPQIADVPIKIGFRLLTLQ